MSPFVVWTLNVFLRHESLTSLLQASSLTCLLVFPYQDLQFYSYSSGHFHPLQTSVFTFHLFFPPRLLLALDFYFLTLFLLLYEVESPLLCNLSLHLAG